MMNGLLLSLWYTFKSKIKDTSLAVTTGEALPKVVVDTHADVLSVGTRDACDRLQKQLKEYQDLHISARAHHRGEPS